MLEMTEREKFRFDLEGYLLVKDFLTPDEVKALNEAVDANVVPMEEYEWTGPSAVRRWHGRGVRSSPRIGNGYLGRTVVSAVSRSHRSSEPDPICKLALRSRLEARFRAFHHNGSQGMRGTWPPRLHQSPLRRSSVLRFCQRPVPNWIDTIPVPTAGYRGGQRRSDGHARQSQGKLQMPGGYHALQHRPGSGAQRRVQGRRPGYLHGGHDSRIPALESGLRTPVAHLPIQSQICNYSPGIYETEMPEWFDELTEVQKAVLESPYVHSRPLIEDDVKTLVRPGAEPKNHIPRKRLEF